MTDNSSLKKYMHLAGAYFSYTLLILLAVSLKFGGPAYFATVVYFFLIIPLLDAIVEQDRNGFTAESYSLLEIAILKFAPIGLSIGYAVLFFLYSLEFTSMDTLEKTGAVLSMGITSAATISTGHEMIHKYDSFISKVFARLGLMLAGSMPFEYTHIFCHHKDACTKFDNQTGWKNESVYSFIWRTVPDAFMFALKYERERLEGLNKDFISPQNKILWFTGLPLLLAGLLWFFVGPWATIFYLLQASVAALSLEIVNYVQHYGLLREQNRDGTYAPMEVVHSWNAYHTFSSHITFMLQRHSDHHTAPAKDYFYLQAEKNAPELPCGYPLMMLATLIPPLWRAIIHPRLAKWSA